MLIWAQLDCGLGFLDLRGSLVCHSNSRCWATRADGPRFSLAVPLVTEEKLGADGFSQKIVYFVPAQPYSI